MKISDPPAAKCGRILFCRIPPNQQQANQRIFDRIKLNGVFHDGIRRSYLSIGLCFNGRSFYNAQHPHYNRTETKVYCRFNNEIDSYKADYKISPHICEARARSPFADSAVEKHYAAQQEHSGVHQGTHYRCRKYSQPSVLVLQQPVNGSSSNSCQNAFKQTGNDCSRHADRKERRRVGHKNDRSENQSQPRSRFPAVESRAHYNRDKHQRNAERSEPDAYCQCLKHDNDSGKHSHYRKHKGFLFCF